MSKAWIENILSDISERDDVFCWEFLSTVIFVGVDRSEITLDDDLSDAFRCWGIKDIAFATFDQSDRTPRPGAYVADGDCLWQARKLYNDINGTFLTSCLPHQHG